jgi:hypothetical protein
MPPKEPMERSSRSSVMTNTMFGRWAVWAATSPRPSCVPAPEDTNTMATATAARKPLKARAPTRLVWSPLRRFRPVANKRTRFTFLLA